MKGKEIMSRKGIFFIILGLVVLSVPFFRHEQDVKQANRYIEEMEEIGVSDDGKEDRPEKEKDKAGIGKKKASGKIPEGAIGIIEIKSLDLCYPIFEGAESMQLNSGIGHLPESAGLLEKGNCVLAGHNGSRRGTFFTNLSKIQMGAKVIVTNKEKESHIYEVVDTEIVGSYDASVREESEVECITLFTCAYHGTQRFVCRCRLVESGKNLAEMQKDTTSVFD